MALVRGRQDQYQDGNNSGLLMGRQVQAWETPCRSEDIYPIAFEAENLSLTEPAAPVRVQRFNKSASALKNQAGRIMAGGNFTLQFHVEDMGPWLREMLHCKDYRVGGNILLDDDRLRYADDDYTGLSPGQYPLRPAVRNFRRGPIGGDARVISAANTANVTGTSISGMPFNAPWGTGDCESVQFEIDAAAEADHIDITYTIRGTVGDQTITETLRIFNPGYDSTEPEDTRLVNTSIRVTNRAFDDARDANGFYYSRNKYGTVTGIAISRGDGHTSSSVTCKIDMVKFGRKLNDAALNISATTNLTELTSWRESETSLDYDTTMASTPADTNDRAFPSGQSQLAFVVKGTALNPGGTIRIVGEDYNQEVISEDVVIAGTTNSVVFSCNSYYESNNTSNIRLFAKRYRNSHC